MPLPSLLCVAFASGIAAALAGRSELRISPRPSLLTRGFGAFTLFTVLLLVPISVYFYVFHGDWFLLYLIDVRQIPSAVALVAFVGEGILGAAGYMLGASLVRSQRETSGGILAALIGLGAIALVPAMADRLSVVGSYAQYNGGFGLEPYGNGPLVQGTVLMGLLLLLGLASLLVRLHLSGRRG